MNMLRENSFWGGCSACGGTNHFQTVAQSCASQNCNGIMIITRGNEDSEDENEEEDENEPEDENAMVPEKEEDH